MIGALLSLGLAQPSLLPLLEWPKTGYAASIRLGWSPYRVAAFSVGQESFRGIERVPTLTFASEREWRELHWTADLGFLPYDPLYGLEGEIGLKKKLLFHPLEWSLGLRGGFLMAMGDLGPVREGWRAALSGYTFGLTPALGVGLRWTPDLLVDFEIGYRCYRPLREWTYQEHSGSSSWEKTVQGGNYPTLTLQGWAYRLGFSLGF